MNKTPAAATSAQSRNTNEIKEIKTIADQDSTRICLASGNNNKAGLPSNRAQIDTVILAHTTARYSAYQSRKAASIDDKVEQKRQKLAQVHDWTTIKRQVDKQIKQMCDTWSFKTMSTNSYFVHLDMDAFFASVEERDQPDLATIPMAVGGHSMLSTSNYVARKFGVVSAMPGYIALKLCPRLKIIPCNFKKYATASRQVQAVIEAFLGKSIEMYMDEARFEVPQEGAEQLIVTLRAKVKECTGLTCSAGIALSPALAKLCSNVNKPNGQMCMPKYDWYDTFYKTLPVQKVNGIGKVTASMLEKLWQVKTLEQLWEHRYKLQVAFGPKQAEFLLAVSLGYHGMVEPDDSEEGQDRKSISIERTLSNHLSLTEDRESIEHFLEELASGLADDLNRKHLLCRQVTLKYKTVDFDVFTKSSSILGRPISDASDLADQAKHIFKGIHEDKQVRLLGIRASSLQDMDEASQQQTITEHASCSSCSSSATTSKEFKVNIECPVCGISIACLRPSDPRTDYLINVHMDKCLSQKKRIIKRS